MKRVLSIFIVLILFGSAGGFAQSAAAVDNSAELAALEAALQKDPDDLRLGSNYRQAVVRSAQYDRALAFFETLVEQHDTAPSAHLNFGFAYVDKIPAAGSITQVLLANNALKQFTRAIELKPTWIGYYTRGNSYMYWPKIFGRTPLGIADLQEAMKMQKADQKRIYHIRAFIALGDAYWKMEELDKARATWTEGLAQFPDNPALKMRLVRQGDELKAIMDETYDITKRIDTSLKELWADQREPAK